MGPGDESYPGSLYAADPIGSKSANLSVPAYRKPFRLNVLFGVVSCRSAHGDRCASAGWTIDR